MHAIQIIFWAIALVSVGFALLPLLAALRFRAYVQKEITRERPSFAPKVSVILPCKGIDPGFDENVRSLLTQDYPDFEILFVTATADDPARERLLRLTAGNPHCKVLVAGIQQGRSQKLNNQLAALKQVRPETEALVFIDSDVRLHSTFLRDLVAPLADREVGATTGFRWYVPQKGGLGSYLQATWNGGGLPMLGHESSAYAWGGAMAALTKTFTRAGVQERWKNSLSDDLSLTEAMRSLGLKIHFVPECLVPSYEDRSVRQTIEWTNRQTIVSRVYSPAMWRLIFAMHACLGIGVLSGVLCLAAAIASFPSLLWPSLVMLSPVLVESVNGLMILRVVRRLIPPVDIGLRRTGLLIAMIPAAILLVLYNSLHSLGTNKLRWRGTEYTLNAPDSVVATEP